VENWTQENSQPEVAPFTGHAKLNIQMHSRELLEFLKLFIGEALINCLVLATNNYTSAKLNGPLKQYKGMIKWEELT